MLRLTADGANGTARLARAKAAERKPRGKKKAMANARRLALATGGIATGVLALSVTHCTQAIADMTGSHWALAGLLAIGIDAGMVAAEGAEVTSTGTSAQATVHPWARGYTIAAVLLSMGLNAYAFSQHATGPLTWAAAALGIVIPGLVFGLGRVAAHLWRAGE